MKLARIHRSLIALTTVAAFTFRLRSFYGSGKGSGILQFVEHN